MFSRYGLNPLIHPRIPFSSFARAVGIVLGIAMLAALYPAHKASRLKPVEAMRGA